jgi:hypothetical protein
MMSGSSATYSGPFPDGRGSESRLEQSHNRQGTVGGPNDMDAVVSANRWN